MKHAVMFKKASSATHDAMVGRLANSHALLLDVLRRAWPQAFNGVGRARVVDLRVEYPIVVGRPGGPNGSSGQWVAGFIDLAIVVSMDRPVIILGMPEHSLTVQEIQEVFYIEVKSGRIQLGDLMRQINFYRAHGRDGYWIVISPDDRYKGLLRSQDVAFVRMMVPE